MTEERTTGRRITGNGFSGLLDRAGEAAVCRFVAILTQVLDPMESGQRDRMWNLCLKVLRDLGE